MHICSLFKHGNPSWCGWLILLFAVPCAGWGAQPAKTNAPATNKTAVVTNTAPKELIKSFFETNPEKMGKDPFFPDSIRLKRPDTNKGSTEVKPAVLTQAVLPKIGGVFRSRTGVTVSLNDQEFAKGDKHPMRLGTVTNEVRLLEIRNDSVLITIDGKPFSIPIPD